MRHQSYHSTVTPFFGDQTLLDRMVLAVERVRQRLLRAVAALESAGIPYAIAGGNAVAAWVATVDPSAVRNTQDVDILLRRGDLEAAKVALGAAGFVYRHVSGIDKFLDGPDARARDAVHIVLAGEKIRQEYSIAAPDVTEFEKPDQFHVVALESLVKWKLASHLTNDRVDLFDMLEVGLLDQSWVGRLLPGLGARLQQLIDSPGGIASLRQLLQLIPQIARVQRNLHRHRSIGQILDLVRPRVLHRLLNGALDGGVVFGGVTDIRGV